MSTEIRLLPTARLRDVAALRIGFEALQWVVTLAAAAAILGAVTLMAAPRLLGWQGVIVLSGSMEPDLQVGGLAFVEPDVKVDEIRAGDVISFRGREGQRITHRVVEVVRDSAGVSFRTKGDANDDIDPEPVYARDVMGRVRFDVPYAGYAAQKMRERAWFYAALGIPAALLIAGEIWSIAGELKRRRVRA